MHKLSINEAKNFIEYIRFNRGENLHWEDNTLTDGEIEYQLLDYTNGQFRSVLIRFCDDTTHTYMELYPIEFDNDLSGLVYYMFSDECIEQLIKRVERKASGR